MRDDNPEKSFDAADPVGQAIENFRYPINDPGPPAATNKTFGLQKPIEDWIVNSDSVTVTYETKNRTIEDRKGLLIDALKQKRWEVEIGGVTVPIGNEQVLVSTARGDDRLNLHIMMTTIAAGLRQDGDTFNFADGKPRSVSNADMMAAIGAALSHVQYAFNKEDAITTEINQANTHAKLDLVLDKINEVW